jgi:hypothetical protein
MQLSVALEIKSKPVPAFSLPLDWNVVQSLDLENCIPPKLFLVIKII